MASLIVVCISISKVPPELWRAQLRLFAGRRSKALLFLASNDASTSCDRMASRISFPLSYFITHDQRKRNCWDARYPFRYPRYASFGCRSHGDGKWTHAKFTERGSQWPMGASAYARKFYVCGSSSFLCRVPANARHARPARPFVRCQIFRKRNNN